jgi:hypothetical protein
MKMLEFYPNLNINSGMLQDQTDNVLNTSLECGRPGKKITFQMKSHKIFFCVPKGMLLGNLWKRIQQHLFGGNK